MPGSMCDEFYDCRVPCMPDYKYKLLVKVISIAGHLYL